MASINAQQVARDVIATLKAGKKVRKGAILKKRGYSDSMSKHPIKVTNTKSYQLEIQKAVDLMYKERDEILLQLPKKRNKAHYHQLMTGLDTLTKNINLLTGKSTENKAIHIEISETIANKYNSDLPQD